MDQQSNKDNADRYGLSGQSMVWFWEHYLVGEVDGRNPYASPLQADVRGVTPAFVITAEYDPLRDEGEAYARRLREAGVPTQYQCYAGMIHGYRGPQSMQDAAKALRSTFS